MTDLSKLASLDGMTVDEADTLPAERVKTLDSGIYDAVIDLAYLEKSQGGALMMKVVYKTDTSTVRDRFTLTSGDNKGNRSYYIDQEGKQRPLPDLMRAHQLSQVACGMGFDKLDAQEKTIKLYDFDAQEERPVKKDVVVDLIGKTIKIGVLKVMQNKRTNQGGTWVDTEEAQEVNEVAKVFNSDGQTATEQQAKEPGTFQDKWREKFEGKTINRMKKGAASAPVAGKPAGVVSGSKPLFAD